PGMSREKSPGRVAEVGGYADGRSRAPMSGDAMSAWPPADLVGLLEGDPHACARATGVRAEDGDIIDFTLSYLNEAGSRFLQRPRDELIGRTYRQLWPETVTDGTLPLYRQVVQERVPAVRTVYYDR